MDEFADLEASWEFQLSLKSSSKPIIPMPRQALNRTLTSAMSERGR